VVIEYNVWRADYAQPIAGRNYSQYVPSRATPFANPLISTMAQIYPEDRGTNYAIREGREVANEVALKLAGK
jgi:protoporphyrinogen oxidase